MYSYIHCNKLTTYWNIAQWGYTLFNDSIPRMWMAYLEKHVASSLISSQVYSKQISIHLFILWVRINNRRLTFRQCKDKENTKLIFVTRICKNSGSVVISQNVLIGNEYINENTMKTKVPKSHTIWKIINYWDKIYNPAKKQQFPSQTRYVKSETLQIYLKHTFHVNVTFLQLKLSKVQYFKANNKLTKRKWEECHIVEYLDIHEICSNNSTCNVLFYSGVYPTHSLYLLQKKTAVHWAIAPYFLSSIIMLYQIIDSNLITDFNMSTAFYLQDHFNESADLLLLDFLHFVLFDKNEYHCEIFKIMVHRIHHLEISIAKKISNLHIFDGPDMNSAEIIPTQDADHAKYTYTASTFQLTAMFCTRGKGNLTDFGLLIQSKTLVDVTYTFFNAYASKHLQLPYSICNFDIVTFCVIRVISNTSTLAINATLLEMQYTGPSMLGDLCIYGGYAVYSLRERNDFQELTLECEQSHQTDYHAPSTVKSQSMFSPLKHNELWITFFSYKNYGKISAEISISAVPCHSLMFKPKRYDTHGCREPDQEHIDNFKSMSLEWHQTFFDSSFMAKTSLKRYNYKNFTTENR